MSTAINPPRTTNRLLARVDLNLVIQSAIVGLLFWLGAAILEARDLSREAVGMAPAVTEARDLSRENAVQIGRIAEILQAQTDIQSKYQRLIERVAVLEAQVASGGAG